jgi:hypothetical protein
MFLPVHLRLHLLLLALSDCSTAARFGCWSQDRWTFFPTPVPQTVLGLCFGNCTVSLWELGQVVVSFTWAFIHSVLFEGAWPEARFRVSEGKHFMDDLFQLPLA